MPPFVLFLYRYTVVLSHMNVIEKYVLIIDLRENYKNDILQMFWRNAWCCMYFKVMLKPFHLSESYLMNFKSENNCDKTSHK